MSKFKLNNVYIYIVLSLITLLYIRYRQYSIESFNNELHEIPFFIPRKNKNSLKTVLNLPLVIYHSWQSNSVPPKMKKNIYSLLESNPDFDYYLYSDAASREFIKNNYDNDVVDAFDTLKPGAYKSDLWRYCILYKNGGVYIDIKYNTVVPLISIVERTPTVFINDREIIHNNIKQDCIYNGFIITPPGNKVLKDCIDEIVENCKNKLYKMNDIDVTGPCLLGRNMKKYHDEYYNNNQYRFDEIQGENNIDRINVIYFNSTIILQSYKEYRREQNGYQDTPHYSKLWHIGDIFM
jgi:mannosyltransferase OCH1-like enzyme